ncbi:MAG: hypothetical protein RB191_24520 [Terriglobia bacterium]|nr:hypothetical protein [Terriglobia bacterium]
MTTLEKSDFATEMAAIMDFAETTETKPEAISINIHAPCSIQVHNGDRTGDRVDVHIHGGGAESLEISAASISEFVEASIAGARRGFGDSKER